MIQIFMMGMFAYLHSSVSLIADASLSLNNNSNRNNKVMQDILRNASLSRLILIAIVIIKLCKTCCQWGQQSEMVNQTEDSYFV